MILAEFRVDPLQCPKCTDILCLTGYHFPEKIGALLEQHETIVKAIAA